MAKFKSFFWLEATSTKLYSGLKQLKMDLNALKCIQIHIPQKRPTNANKMVKNAKKWPKIANNCKISEITKYGEIMRNNETNSQKYAKNEPKNGQKMSKLKQSKISAFFWLETTSTN